MEDRGGRDEKHRGDRYLMDGMTGGAEDGSYKKNWRS
jgi:hypothetical protein